MSKFIKTVLIVVVSILGLYFAALSFVSFYYEKEIEQRVVTEINKNLIKPIKISKVGISAFSNFPYVSFSLKDVLIPKSDTSSVPLVKLEKLEILFSPYSILVKKFQVDKILIENGSINARVDSLGNRDFDIVRKKEHVDTVKNSKSITSFDIHKIKFHNIRIFYENKFKPKRLDLLFSNTETELSLNNKVLSGELFGELYSKEVTLKPGTLFKESDLKVDFKFTFDLQTKIFAFNNCVLMSGENSYLANGNLDIKNKSFLTLNVKARNVDIQNAFSLISKRWIKNLTPFNLSGKVSSDVTVKVSLLPGNQPDFSINFSTDSLAIKNNNLKANIHHIRFNGNLNSNHSTSDRDYSITFNDFFARINASDSLEAKKIVLQNFKEPILKTTTHLALSGNTLFDLIGFKEYSDVAGKLKVNLTYDGKLNYLFGDKVQTPELYGDIALNHLRLKLNKLHFGFDDLDGKIDFRRDTIHMNKLAVKSGKTDMQINGTAYNLFNSIFKDTTGLKMNINFTSTNFYFNDFNSNAPKSKSTTASNKSGSNKKLDLVDNGRFVLPYDLQATLKGKVQNFYSQNYHGNNIELGIDLNKNNVKIVESMNSFGGTLSFASNFQPVKDVIYCHSTIRMMKFHIDKVFGAFNNFKQKMLTDDNVRGIVSGNVYSFFVLSSGLVVDTTSIVINGDFNISKLELIKVEPIMILSKVGFDEKDLERVTFEKINTSISIKNNVIEIPRTLFVTNILYFYMDVKITPDGESEINMLLPVKNLKKKPKTKGLTNDSKAGLSIPIKIKGKAGKLTVI